MAEYENFGSEAYADLQNRQMQPLVDHPHMSEQFDDYDGDVDDEPTPSCPTCGGPGVPLGTLGRRQHTRCRNCGMDYSHQT